MFNLTARTENKEMFIAMYETEKPETEYDAEGHPHYPLQQYIDEWQSSKREYKVRDEYKDEIKKLISKEHEAGRISYGPFSVQHLVLEKGIDCTFLKDRLKLGVNCKYDYTSDPKCTKGDCDCEQHWTLLPLEDKKENEAIAFKDWCDNNAMMLDYQYEHNHTTAELYQLFKNPNKQ